MQISNRLPQFENKKALIISAGEQEAVFFLAADGEVEKLDAFRFDEPAYSDREGHFETRAEGRVYGSGSVYEPKKQRIRQEFEKRFKKSASKIVRNYKPTNLYVFAPDYMKNYVKDTLSGVTRQKIDYLIEGHYHDVHPFELIKSLHHKFEEKRERGMISRLSGEALAILKKANLAKKVTGGKRKK